MHRATATSLLALEVLSGAFDYPSLSLIERHNLNQSVALHCSSADESQDVRNFRVLTGGNKDGAIDALCHGKLGALVDPNDLDAIAQTLIQILQGKYLHPIMYQLEVLRQKDIEAFGFERFKQTLAELI